MIARNGLARISALTVLLFLSFPCTVFSRYTGPMRLSVFWPCSGNSSACEPEVLAEGTIEPDTADKFLKFIAGKNKSPYYLPPKPTVCFDSPGGDLRGAIKFGEIIREREFDTCLGTEYSRVSEKKDGGISGEEVFQKDVVCASACIFALAGGVNRYVSEKSRLGVHQFSGAQGPIGDSDTQLTVVALAAYLEKMGVKRELLDIASLFPPDQLHWLSPQEIKTSRIDNCWMIPGEWKLETTANGDIFAQISQEKLVFHSRVGLLLTKQKSRAVLVVIFEPGMKKVSSKEVLDALNNHDGWISIDGSDVASFKSIYWKQTGKLFTTSLSLSPQAIQTLWTGKRISLLFMVPRCFDVYDPSLEFPLEGLARLLPAVFK
ncbi:MAG: hypothetical protein ABSF90_22540 [Syntrophobacteraceae bacterium]|jgi:hypothetical protein